MNKLQIFRNGFFGSVRATMIDDEPWFVGSDVAKSLDYEILPRAIQDHVDDDDKQVVNGRDYVIADDEDDTPISNRDITIINEAGVYSLIFGSKQERAKEFKRWVTHEVLPALRKTGQYSMNRKRIELDGDNALELARIFSTVEPANLPYVLASLKLAGLDIHPDSNLLPDGADHDAEADILKFSAPKRRFPDDWELVRMIGSYRDAGFNMQELSRRSFVPAATLYALRKGSGNTCPEFAARIKEQIREVFEEHGMEVPKYNDYWRTMI